MPADDPLHLPSSIADALERLGWTSGDPALREAVPTVARGHNLVIVLPPGPAHAVPVLAGLVARLGEGRRGLLLAPAAQLQEWGEEAHRLGAGALRTQVAQGTARALRRLRTDGVDLLVTTPESALALHRRSGLGLDGVVAVLLAWPESWDDEAGLAPIMQDLSKDAQRIVVTAAPAAVGDLVDRYARRALTLGPPPDAAPAEPAGPVRTATVSWERRAAALADLVELLDPASLVVWTAHRGRHAEIARRLGLGEPDLQLATGDAPGAALVVAFDPPSPERLRQLLSAGDVVLLAPPDTAPYIERIASPRRPVRLPGLFDAVTTEAGARRAAIVRAIETGRPERALLTLAPLFERHDPAAVAAALYELWTASGTGVPSAVPDIPATSRIWVGLGKKDGATVNDLVAVLTKEVGVERGKIGRVELRDAFALVEVPARDAERVAASLNGLSIRRKRVTARVDRGATRPVRPGRPARPGSRPTR